MEYIPVKTRVMQPPKDDLFAMLDESLTDVREGDLVLITSKVVSIHQGRCVPLSDDKRALVEEEAEHWINGHEKYSQSPLAIKYNGLFYAAGIDESNSGDYYTLLPEDPFKAAREIWDYIRTKHNLDNVGVIITDSHTQPLRWGVSSISIGYWGFHSINKHRGKLDLFGRKIKLSSTNVPDSVCAGATLVSGEGDECVPIVIARNVPTVQFTEVDTRDELLVSYKDDLYYPLLKPFYDDK